MKRLVITGALGHIGSALIHSLRAGDWESVILVDNVSTQRYVSLFGLPVGIDFRFYEEDITSADLDSHIKGATAVLHLAAITNAEASLHMIPEVERVNVGGTERVAHACARAGVPFIFLSTTSVYGMHNERVDENCAIGDGTSQSPYAASKCRAERQLSAIASREGLRFMICRFGTIVGWSVGMRFHTAINKFCWQACGDQPVTIWRTAGNQIRPYLDLGQAVGALKFILDRNVFDNQIYNILSVNATVGAFLDIIRTRVPDLHIEYVDSPVMNQLSYHVQNEKFEGLGFRFDPLLEKGVHLILEKLWGLAQGRLGPWGNQRP